MEIQFQFSGRLIRPAPSDVLDNYRVEVEYTDRYLGELEALFESRGIGEDILWVIVSDHGEGLFNHNCLGHAEYVFEDQLRILWLMRGAGVPEGRVVDDTAALMVDVPATLLDLVGLPASDASKGTPWWIAGTTNPVLLGMLGGPMPFITTRIVSLPWRGIAGPISGSGDAVKVAGLTCLPRTRGSTRPAGGPGRQPPGRAQEACREF